MNVVTAEIGTTGESGTVTITTNPSADLAHAVLLEHSDRDGSLCSNHSCDIAAAVDAGFGIAAAWMMTGATECPLIHAVLEYYGPDKVGTHLYDCPDWDGWKAWFDDNAIRCGSCEAFNFPLDDSVPTICGNCLAPLS